MSFIPNPSQDQVTLGNVDGVTGESGIGERTGINTSDGVVLITSDNTTGAPTILSTASTFTIAYNSSTDGSGTTGALILTITYLDANGEIQVGIHVLGNSGSDVTAFSGLGINRVTVASSGSGDKNGNDIAITATTGGSVQAFMSAGASLTKQALYHFPTDAASVFKYLYFSAVKQSGSSPVVTFRVMLYSRTTDTEYEAFRYTMDTSSETYAEFIDPVAFRVNGNSVIWATASTTANGTEVESTFSFNTYEN